MEGDAISSVYILLYAATITTLSLSLCVYSVCVCMYTWWKTEHVPPENRGGLYNTTGRRPIGRIHGSLYKDKPAWWWVPPGLDCILMSSLFLVPSLHYILLPPTTLKSRRKMCNMSTHTHTEAYNPAPAFVRCALRNGRMYCIIIRLIDIHSAMLNGWNIRLPSHSEWNGTFLFSSFFVLLLFDICWRRGTAENDKRQWIMYMWRNK